MIERTDRRLVEEAQRGDKGAIGELFSRYWRAARAVAFGVTGEFASAEDAAAEAFNQALIGIHSLRDPDRFASWLRTIVMRKARLARPCLYPPIDAFVDGLSDENEGPDEELARAELRALIQEGVRGLPGPLREAMALVYFEGYDSDLAARFLDIPAGTLRRRLHEGRVRLRTAVEQTLQGSKQVSEERESQIRRFETMIQKGEIFQALRGSLQLRPPPTELIDVLLRRRVAPMSESQSVATGKEPTGLVQAIVQRLLQPSDRASDPAHPVGQTVVAIRKVLPDFQDWALDIRAVSRFMATTGEYHDRSAGCYAARLC